MLDIGTNVKNVFIVCLLIGIPVRFSWLLEGLKVEVFNKPQCLNEIIKKLKAPSVQTVPSA